MNQTSSEWAGEEVVRGLRNRNPELLSRLIEQHQDRLFRYLIHLLGNRQTAEDLCQETWLRVLERGHQYKGDWKFETWLLTIARNLTIDLMRRKRAVSLDLLCNPEVGVGLQPVAQTTPPPDWMQENERWERLNRLLQRLPPACQEAFLLRAVEGLPLATIAERMKIPVATAKSRFYRSVAFLSERLQACDA